MLERSNRFGFRSKKSPAELFGVPGFEESVRVFVEKVVTELVDGVKSLAVLAAASLGDCLIFN